MTSRPSAKAATLAGTSAALPGGAERQPDVGGASAPRRRDAPSPEPTWVAEHRADRLAEHAHHRAGHRRGLLGQRGAHVRRPRISATGSTSTFHTSVVPTTHSARLQAAVELTPEGNVVVSSSQWSASRTASGPRRAGSARGRGRAAGRPPCGRCRRRGPSSRAVVRLHHRLDLAEERPRSGMPPKNCSNGVPEKGLAPSGSSGGGSWVMAPRYAVRGRRTRAFADRGRASPWRPSRGPEMA